MTSFAPSPIAKVILSVFYLTNLTTFAFYLGVHRQTTTEWHFYAISKNLRSYFLDLSKTTLSASPSIKIAYFLFSFLHFSRLIYVSLKKFSIDAFIPFFNLVICIELFISLQLFAIFSAVPNLSPVNIQTLISKNLIIFCLFYLLLIRNGLFQVPYIKVYLQHKLHRFQIILIPYHRLISIVLLHNLDLFLYLQLIKKIISNHPQLVA